MSYNFIRWSMLQESNTPKTLELFKLPYHREDLDPSISLETINYHYGKLAKSYVDRYNAGEGDADFNEAGAYLHNILFPQYRKHAASNAPSGAALEFINKHHKSFDNFKEKFSKTAMGIQGSGWVYLARNGEIKTIVNHQTRSDIVLLIDWWEHAFQFDYGSDKKKYLENQWKIIDWDIVSARVG